MSKIIGAYTFEKVRKVPADLNSALTEGIDVVPMSMVTQLGLIEWASYFVEDEEGLEIPQLEAHAILLSLCYDETQRFIADLSASGKIAALLGEMDD